MTDQYGSGAMPPPPDAGPASQGTAPSTVINAVRLMYLSAVLGILGMVAALATMDSLRDSIRDSQPKLSPSEVDTAVTVGIAFAIAVGIVFTILWLVLANFVRKGRNWARIVTWVLCGLGVLSVFGLFGQPPLSLIVGAIGVIVDIAIIVLLAMKPSSEYFARPK